MLEATPSAGFREASVECAGGGRGNDASERWTGGHNVHVHSLLLLYADPAWREPSPSSSHRRTVKKTFRLLNISTRRLVIIPKLLTRVVLSSSIRWDNRYRRLFEEKPYLDSQLIKHLYRDQSFHLVTEPIYLTIIIDDIR